MNQACWFLAGASKITLSWGIREATLTHHLSAMETAGLISRRRDPANRRVHIVEVTPAGDEMFVTLRAAAIDFDRRLRGGISEQETSRLRGLLAKLADNARPAAG